MLKLDVDLAQLLERAVSADFGGADGAFEDAGDFGEGELLETGEEEHFAIVPVEAGKRSVQEGVIITDGRVVRGVRGLVGMILQVGGIGGAGGAELIAELVEHAALGVEHEAIGEGGGLTLSGGEPMLRAAFIEELLGGLSGVDVRIETSGQAPRKSFERLAPLVDGFLFDYKVTGASRHEELCGGGNDLILGNLDFLCSSGADVVLRLPLVPRVNDGEEHLAAIAALLGKYPGITGAEIMPYHNLGASKAERLGLTPGACSIPNADETTIESWLSRFAFYGAKGVRVSR